VSAHDPGNTTAAIESLLQPVGNAAVIAEQAAILDRVTEFVRWGVRASRISPESAELLITAAEREHDQAVKRLRAGGGYIT
jgi:hypothetical protein